MIHLDTSVLLDALTGPRRCAAELRHWIERGERIRLSTLVLYEWLRGPRLEEELTAQEALLPRVAAVAFGPREAAIATQAYRTVRNPRGREVDLAIAACAIAERARLWTLNRKDFKDIPGIVLATQDGGSPADPYPS